LPSKAPTSSKTAKEDAFNKICYWQKVSSLFLVLEQLLLMWSFLHQIVSGKRKSMYEDALNWEQKITLWLPWYKLSFLVKLSACSSKFLPPAAKAQAVVGLG
jgi:hypothetical protein